VVRVQRETEAAIALCSLGPIGEDPKPTSPIQARLNALALEYSTVVKLVAEEQEVAYLPLYERLSELILSSPGSALTAFKTLDMYVTLSRPWCFAESLMTLAHGVAGVCTPTASTSISGATEFLRTSYRAFPGAKHGCARATTTSRPGFGLARP
jgi:hypothetical protein